MKKKTLFEKLRTKLISLSFGLRGAKDWQHLFETADWALVDEGFEDNISDEIIANWLSDKVDLEVRLEMVAHLRAKYHARNLAKKLDEDADNFANAYVASLEDSEGLEGNE